MSGQFFVEFFLNDKYINNKNHVFVQDEQKLVKDELQYKDAIYKQNTNENGKTNTT
jgi:hypothetical protein